MQALPGAQGNWAPKIFVGAQAVRRGNRLAYLQYQHDMTFGLKHSWTECRASVRFEVRKTHPPVPLLIATKSWLMLSNLHRLRALVLGGGVNTVAPAGATEHTVQARARGEMYQVVEHSP